MSSDLMSTEYLNNYNNNTTTTATSTLPNAEPSQNSKRTTPGWFLQQTRGWPWSSWTNKIIPTKPKHYYRTPTHTKCSPRIPPPNLKTNSSPFSKTLTNRRPHHPNIQTTLPHQCSPPKFYGLPKIHKTGTPLRPIVSSRGSITYGVAKELSHIIKPLVHQSPQKHPTFHSTASKAKGWNQRKSSPPMM